MTALNAGPNASWLDAEIRKGRAVLNDLREVVDQQQITLVDQTQRIMALEDQAAKLRAQLVRVPEIEQALRHTRDEIVLLISGLREAVQKRETESLRVRQAEREQDARALQEIRVELQRFAVVDKSIAGLGAESHRLNDVILRLGAEVDALQANRTRDIDARSQLGERIAKNSQTASSTQAQTAEMAQSVKRQSGRLLIVEQTLPKLEESVAALSDMRRELTAQQDELLESQRRADVSRSQTLTEWSRQLESFGHQIDVWSDKLVFFTDQHEKSRRVLRDMQDLSQGLSQQQDRLRQLQRVTEEQLRRELREWKSDNDRRWAQETERVERTADEQAAANSSRDQRLTGLEQARDQLVLLTDVLGKKLDAIQHEGEVSVGQLRGMQESTWKTFARGIEAVLSELQDTPEEDI